MKMKEIRELSEKEREEKLADLEEEYFNLKFQLATGKIENPGRMKHMRRDIARIKTLRGELKQSADQTGQPKAETSSSEKTGEKK
ncbi:50S ribosomal protein L29 [Nitrospina gracilis]|uniref:50S ribosomal protein L29 n=1 Tax=Nitrospina gracilis TaxID=35801 RepID=UPI001F0216B2|nr:50S ribosomal protein L29 [Nitrospina gracilis]MCF8721733.1 large subunit ribosomal protein L29 [Nitrospina gracilis Nb-211]